MLRVLVGRVFENRWCRWSFSSCSSRWGWGPWCRVRWVFGFALVVVPALTLIRPEVLPATVLLLTLPMALTMAVRERHAMNISGLAYLLFGRVVGTFGGVGLLLLVPDSHLSVLFGSLVVVAVIASSFSSEVGLRKRTQVVGGIASGVMGTAAGIGGPPLALITRADQGRRFGPRSQSPSRWGRCSLFWPWLPQRGPARSISFSRSDSFPRFS